LAAPVHTLAAALDEYVIKEPSFAAPISLVRDRAPSALQRKLGDYDIIHLHGINGAIRLDELAARHPNARIVWTLHDMNPFTGSCHYSLGCDNFMTDCSLCPAVRGAWQARVSRHLSDKADSIAQLRNLSVVSPSSWLAEQASRSVALRDKHISVIPNPVSPQIFNPHDTQSPRDDGIFRVIVVAQNLSDPVKDVQSAIDSYHAVFSSHDAAELVLVGNQGEGLASRHIRHTGPLSSAALGELLGQCDVIIVSSLAENAPLVIAEAAVRGVVPFVRDVGGMREMVELAGAGGSFSHPDELAVLLKSHAAMPSAARATTRRALMTKARAVFGVESVVAEYDKVYGD
jgi:glycosyltransferase involved in cell wall biosynthesis